MRLLIFKGCFFKKKESSFCRQSCVIPKIFYYSYFITTTAFLKFLVIPFVILGHDIIQDIAYQIN